MTSVVCFTVCAYFNNFSHHYMVIFELRFVQINMRKSRGSYLLKINYFVDLDNRKIRKVKLVPNLR